MFCEQQRTISLLLIDRTEISREAVARFIRLKLPKFSLKVTDYFEAGIKICQSHPVDLVIADIKSAEDVYYRHFVEELITLNYKTKFILITSSSKSDDLAAITQTENVSLVQKPLSLRELLALIAMSLNIEAEDKVHGSPQLD